jgi:hypothetical protein
MRAITCTQVAAGPFLPGMKAKDSGAEEAEKQQQLSEAADWEETLSNLVDRFSIPRDLAERKLVQANGHGGKAVMELGLDSIDKPEDAEVRVAAITPLLLPLLRIRTGVGHMRAIKWDSVQLVQQ